MKRSPAEFQKAELLCAEVCLAAQRLDPFLHTGNARKEVFEPHVLALRDVVPQVCVRVRFPYPVSYGRKAEDLYSDVVVLLMKTNRRHKDTVILWEGTLWVHLKGSLRFYEYLFLFLWGHYELGLQSYADWPRGEIHLISCEKGDPHQSKRLPGHRCLLYLGDLSHCQSDFLDLATMDLAERCCGPKHGGALQPAGGAGKYYVASTGKCFFGRQLGTSNWPMILWGSLTAIQKGTRERNCLASRGTLRTANDFWLVLSTFRVSCSLRGDSGRPSW